MSQRKQAPSDPMEPRVIAGAIDRLLQDRTLAETMGVNGARAVREKFNWRAEEKKLLAFYERIFSRDSHAGASAQ